MAMVVGQATADHDPVMAIRAGMDPGPVTAAVDLAAIMAGMAARGRAPVINQVDHPEEVAAVAVHGLAGTAIPVAAVDINKVRAQVARAAATCARTAISVTAAMVGRAAAIANC